MLLHDGHGHDHNHMHEEGKQAVAQSIWRQETVELTTTGIDVGSSTSHLLFAKIRLQRCSQSLSSRFMITAREVIYHSPIILTPFLPGGLIDVENLGSFINESYRNAGFQRKDIDSGAVILTGEAIKKKNARNIADFFAEEAGKFVCATAGHKLECILAAHGSGAVALSKERDECLLHVDMGGGTTKIALIDSGIILGVCAFAVGGRLIAQDAEGLWVRVDESAQLVADKLKLKTDPKSLEDPAVRQKIAECLADITVEFICGNPITHLGMSLQLTENITRKIQPVALTFSGGVSEYLLHNEQKCFGDIAKMLADHLREKLSKKVCLPIQNPGQGIRATVIGASQFTVQVSGKTIYLSDDKILPVRNVPVIHVPLDLSGKIDKKQVVQSIQKGIHRMDLAVGSNLAIAFNWQGDPEYSRLRAMAESIVDSVGLGGEREEVLLLMIEGDIANLIGNLLVQELGFSKGLISVDGVQLKELDFVDVGELIEPQGVVPIVIKSLIFA